MSLQLFGQLLLVVEVFCHLFGGQDRKASVGWLRLAYSVFVALFEVLLEVILHPLFGEFNDVLPDVYVEFLED